MAKLYSLIYRSYARPPWIGDKSLQEIAEEANEFNAANDISGLLILSNGVFIQVLEGETVQILELTARIAADRRNERLRVLWHSLIDVRRFPKWSMGCFDVSDLGSKVGAVADAISTPIGLEPVWTDGMTQELINFYRDNEVAGMTPVFNVMRRIV